MRMTRDDGVEREHRDQDPARVTIDRLAELDDVCGSEPPMRLMDTHGVEWVPGDCWCTREQGHEGDCRCDICADRYGAPGWTAGVG